MCGTLPNYFFASEQPYSYTNISGNTFSCPLPDWCNGSICSPCNSADTCFSFSVTPTQSPTQTSTSTPTPTYTTTPSKTPTSAASSLPTTLITLTISETANNTKTPTNSVSNTQTSSQTIFQKTPSMVLLGPSIVNFPGKSISSTPSSFYLNIPTISPKSPSGINCIRNNCENGNIQHEISPNSAVQLLTDTGRNVGNVFFSDDIEGFLDISFITNIESDTIGNTIVDITISDFNGNSVSELPSSIKICLAQEKTNENICLSFFNTKTEEWECQDKCLSREDNQYCGTTDHLTSFALLLQGGNNKGGNCDSSEDYILAWLSMALFIFAILVIVICVLFNEVRFRLIYQRKKRIMSLMAGTAECNENLNYSDNYG